MKKILYLLLLALMVIGVNAGNGNKTVTGGPYKVGDYYNDGTKEGIVFVVYDGGYHGKIVSLDEETDGLWALIAAVEKPTGAESKTAGMSNMNKIKKQPNWKTLYPAFAWCASSGSGWYLPAIDELKLIYQNKSIINRRLDERGYCEIQGYYWSSTEEWSTDFGSSCAWFFCMNDGSVDSSYKSYFNSVRAVAAF